MITPSYGLTATERVLPNIALDFTTAILDSRVTFTRTGDTATVTNSSGVIVGINANLPRFDYDPTTLVCKGLLIEEARTNLLLNSLINGTSLSTQLVTTTAVSQTLSFYGTGQIVLTGTSSATVVGTGAYPARQTLTFTPTAGVLTLTVTGTVQYAQLEVGAFATSFIPTDGTTKTRNADVATMTGTNFSSWFTDPGTTVIEWDFPYNVVGNRGPLWFNAGANARGIGINYQSVGAIAGVYRDATGAQYQSPSRSPAYPRTRAAFGFSNTALSFASNGSAAVTATSASVSVATINQVQLGACSVAGSNTGLISGVLRKFLFYPYKLTNAEIQAFSKKES